MSKFFPRSALAAACTALCAAVSAQTATPPTESVLQPVTVTANPLGGSDVIAPAQALTGTGLLLRQQSTIGEALNGLPGVSSSYFGPNASRPIIRGLDGDRIRILSNSGATIDASGLSYDHAVALDPIAVERIEVLRGPGALLYGGSAVGGVVNVIDNRIPKERLAGMTGKVDFGLSSGNSGKNGAFMIETGNDKFALHADVSARSSGDVSVPVNLACTKPGSPPTQKKICNSAADAKSGAIGGSLFFGQSRIGLSVSSFTTNYGTVAEDEVTIDMNSRRTAMDADFKIGSFIDSVQVQASNTSYKHTEFEGATAGTEFKNNGNDLRLQARHAKIANLQGVIGLQLDNNRFSADGAEAFAPYSKTSQQALFLYEEAAFNWGKLSFGGRIENVKVQSFGNPIIARFTPAQRDFKPSSYSAGALLNLNPAWQFTGNFAATQRAPKDYELFADGPHIATAAYEVGDTNLRKEKSTSFDVGARWKSGAHFAQINVFNSRFKNYILLDATGNTRGADAELNPVDADGDGVADGSGEDIFPEYAYAQVPARFTGFELSGNWRLMDAANKLDLQWRVDSTRATNTANGQTLPRISPLRMGATLVWAQGAWGARIGFDHNAKARDASTESYVLWNLAATYKMKAKDADLLWFARLDNAGDKLAYSATSILSTSAPGKSPLPGRSFKVGLQAQF
ncbi:TonB-dependent receptor [Variovorax sp. PCZ-1]|uniref:TonB-dependent receptor n=1 Tax=Variovorax sp. PCZ-1 TaxID=2835533 RepID=UPI001BCECFFC|nr:TonB-dependent receptor [Variovorax sp. PCZ-1]MBS7808348.1 TonB-dependent receptor [Variovorax sp. PCZ-1]